MSPDQQEVKVDAEGDLAPHRNGIGAERQTSGTRLSSKEGQPQDVLAFKFGGSSLLGAERMLHAARLVENAAQSSALTVVVSAMKGVTDRLLRLAQLIQGAEWARATREAEHIMQLHLDTLADLQLAEEDYDRVSYEVRLLGRDLLHETEARRAAHFAAAADRLASFGERFSARLFAAALEKLGLAAVPVASSDFVLTCDTFQSAEPSMEATRRRGQEVLLPLLEAEIIPVVTGFIGATDDGRITTLGRNSSDFSGAIIAHVVDAEELVIWTDVDGIYTANPRESAEAKLLHVMSYDDAHALALNGAKVLHPQVLPLAAQTQMTVWVRNTFKPEHQGTRIGPNGKGGVA
jgi:bifunctional aspartokinase / homoserine dehydrogenase 1